MINLLPKKYIKNKAPLAIGIITSILFILGLVIFSVQLFSYLDKSNRQKRHWSLKSSKQLS